MSIEIKKIDPFQDHQLIPQIARVYRETFAANPWYEGAKCPVCEGREFVSMIGSVCPYCSPEKKVIMLEFWPEAEVVRDFYKEMSKPEAVCLVAIQMGCVAGFAWGYQLKINREVCQKLGAEHLLHRHAFDEVFYIDEVAVHPDYQSRGIGKSLTTMIIEGQALPKLLRTKAGSKMQDISLSLGGKIITDASDDRVMISFK